jgi:hypothetical protein
MTPLGIEPTTFQVVAQWLKDKGVGTIKYSYILREHGGRQTNDMPANGLTLKRIILPLKLWRLCATQICDPVMYSWGGQADGSQWWKVQAVWDRSSTTTGTACSWQVLSCNMVTPLVSILWCFLSIVVQGCQRVQQYWCILMMSGSLHTEVQKDSRFRSD